MKSTAKFHKVMIPIGAGSDAQASLALAQVIGKDIVLVGIVPIEKEGTVSAGAQPARQVRKRLMELSQGSSIRFKSSVIVSETPWHDLQPVIAEEKPDLLMVEWKHGITPFEIPTPDLLSTSLCNVCIVRAVLPIQLERIMVAVRGGPYAEWALRLGMRLNPSSVDLLHLSLKGAVSDAAFKGLKRILPNLPGVNLRSITTEDIARSIYEESENYDLVILGAKAGRSTSGPSLGPVAEKLLSESTRNLIVVKTRSPILESMFDETAGERAISILVDKWFAENTFHGNEFADLQQLMDLKEKQGSVISLALPALNEEKTVGKVITTIKKALMEEMPLVDEMVLIDSNSTDRTREIAESLGIPVYIHQELLPELGARHGKGEALWKSLLVTRGDIIAWIDTDIVNIHPRFVYGILGPLLLNQQVQFVKGYYRRPLRVGGTVRSGGGRVTELTARPLLNLFYPELSGIIQPLSGEYAGRREALENATFFSGYGVEIGLLIDIFELYGLKSIAQVDLLERIHHNQDLEALSKMSFAIIQTVLRKLETRYERSIIEDVNKTMKLIRRAKGGYFLDVEEVIELERPPMKSIPQYKNRNKA